VLGNPHSLLNQLQTYTEEFRRPNPHLVNLHARAQKLAYFPYFASVVLLQPTDRLKASARGSNTFVATRWLAGWLVYKASNELTTLLNSSGG